MYAEGTHCTIYYFDGANVFTVVNNADAKFQRFRTFHLASPATLYLFLNHGLGGPLDGTYVWRVVESVISWMSWPLSRRVSRRLGYLTPLTDTAKVPLAYFHN